MENIKQRFDKEFPSRRDCSNGEHHTETCQGCIDIVVEEPQLLIQFSENEVRLERERALNILVKEIAEAHKSGVPTARLTSAYNKILHTDLPI